MKKKNTKQILAAMFSLSLTACQSGQCYECYIGSMYVSSASKSYDSINQKEIVDKASESETLHYADYYLIKEEDRDVFFYQSDYGITFDQKEINRLSLKENDIDFLYVFAQIPAGYEAYKRDNVQGYILDYEKQILLTDNLYYFTNRSDILYCEIDIKTNEEITSDYVYAFYFELSNELEYLFSVGSIRFLYKIGS